MYTRVLSNGVSQCFRHHQGGMEMRSAFSCPCCNDLSLHSFCQQKNHFPTQLLLTIFSPETGTLHFFGA